MKNKQKHLLKEERFCIEKMKKAGFSSEDIAKTIGRGKSTVDEELRRNGGIKEYRYKKALDWLNERPRECLGWMTASMCVRQQEELLLFS